LLSLHRVNNTTLQLYIFNLVTYHEFIAYRVYTFINIIQYVTMEDTHATVVPASRTGHLHISHGNRLHVRVSVHGNELELTDERADNKTASTNIQELISAFARALKATGNNTPVATHFVTENPQSSSICTETPEFKSEVMRLQQRVQKFEGEVMHLRQLLQNSKEENEVQKVRFRAVTHMKAEELAHKLSKINIVHNVADGYGLEGTSGLAEPFTPEQGPTEFALNSKVKEIDFLSLDDILGKDNASDFSSKRIDEDMPMGDSKVITNNSGSVLGTVKHLPSDHTKIDKLTFFIRFLTMMGSSWMSHQHRLLSCQK